MVNQLAPERKESNPSNRAPAAWRHPTAANDNLRDVIDALTYIPSDVGRGIGSIIGHDGQPVDDYWFGVILAACRDLGPEAEVIMRDWSKRSHRYVEKGFDQAWNAFDPDHPNPVTLGSVFALARAKGWPGPAKVPTTLLASASHYALLDRAAIMALEPLEWRVKGLFC